MSQRTTLCLVNVSGHDIAAMLVSGASGFEKGNDPSGFIHGPLPNQDSVTGYVELIAAPANFTVGLTFADGTTLSFTDDQQSAQTRHIGVIPHTGTAQGLEVWRSTGGDVGDSSHGTNGLYIRTVAVPDHSGWMGALQKRKPGILLNDVTMPGSHDAGMYVTHDYPLGGGGEWAKTQSLTTLQQLQAGSRYFDLRICWRDGHLSTYHGDTGYGAYGALLSDILTDVQAFLTGPSGNEEVVILKFSHTYTDTIDSIIDVVKTQSMRLMLPKQGSGTNLAQTPLSMMKGKIVMVFDSEFEGEWDQAQGIWPYFDTTENPSSVIGRDLTVYDHYADQTDYPTMAGDQTAKLGKYGGWGDSYLFLLSWTLTGDTQVRDIEVLAGMANPWLPQVLADKTIRYGRRPNIVYLDFIDPWLCGVILGLNDQVLIRRYNYASAGGIGDCLGMCPPSGGWQFPVPLFYAPTVAAAGNVPVYQYQAHDPERYCYTLDSDFPFGTREQAPFFGLVTGQPDSAPLYQYIKPFTDKHGKPQTAYGYGLTTTPPAGWGNSGVAFDVLPYR
ncbi:MULTISPECIES: hypothetical protein [unclassified Pseudomonas]|uniref:hypothetical protein n=1 Tax=unclassified Pseudomonas TaxID=196821 RepID=UPI00111BF5F9|nr:MULTISPECIES: hypothetical protein [unclassified Pseudomonas]